MMLVWAGLVVPTMLLWKESILWVAFMSLYANFVGHFASMDAARAEKASDEKLERIEAKLDRANERLMPRSAGGPGGPSW